MNKRLRIFWVSLALMSFADSINAQQAVSLPSLGNDIPTSPQAEAFKKLGEFSVDNAYGQPDITIPLWEIDQFGYKIPLVLRYQASPMKPGYNYDVYGLGWSLTGSSCVSRTIKGLPDDEISKTSSDRRFKIEDWSKTMYYTDWNTRLDCINTGYDDFTITLPSGRSIPFYITLDSKSNLIYNVLPSDRHVRIECNFKKQNSDTRSNSRIEWFVVTDEAGVKYSFTQAEKGQNTYKNDMSAQSNVSWLLTSVDIPNKGTIKYTYTEPISISTFTVDEPILVVERTQCWWHLDESGVINCPHRPLQLKFEMQKQCPMYTMNFIKTISYGPATLSFDYSSDGKQVKSIEVTDSDRIVRRFDMTYSNQTNVSLLKTLTIKGNNEVDKLTYKFTYQSGYNSGMTDYWGNLGSCSRNTDVGNFNVRLDTGLSDSDYGFEMTAWNGYVNKKSKDRLGFHRLNIQKKPNGEGRKATGPNQHYALSRITYPNGGYTTFEFEQHRFLTANTIDGELELNRRKQRILEGGGFRIKEIRNYTRDGKLADYKQYKYGYTVDYVEKNNLPFPKMQKENSQTHTGLGEAVVDPNLLTFMDYEYSTSYIPRGFMEMMVGKHLEGNFSFENQDRCLNSYFMEAWWFTARFSAAYFRKLLGGRPAVIYPEITIYNGKGDSTKGNLSKTVLTFENIYGVFNARLHYLSEAGTDYSKPDTLYFEPIRYSSSGGVRFLETIEYPHKRGQLKTKAEYVIKQVYANTFADILMSKEEYDYQEETMTSQEYLYTNTYSRGHGDVHNLNRAYGQIPEYSLLLRAFYAQTQNVRGSSQKVGTIYTNSRYSNGSISNSVKNSFVYGDAVRQTNYWNLSNKKNTYVYSADSAGYSSIYMDLQNRNILTLPLEESTYDLGHPDQRPAVSFKTEYAYFGNSILPKRIYAYNQKVYEGVYEVVSYTEHGKPQEVIDLRTGVHTTYLWGYSGRYMIARIQNATYSQVMAALSNSGKANACIDDVRKSGTLYNTMIESWTYLPLVGIKTYTDQTGMTTVYEYDGLGRLKSDGIQYPGGTEIKHSYEYNFLNK